MTAGWSEAAGVYFEAATAAWEDANARSGGAQARRFALGGSVIELRFAGGALVPLLYRAFAHLDDRPGPSFVIRIFDSETSGVPIPRPPWGLDDYREHGRIRGYNDERFQTVFEHGSGSLHLLDRERAEALYWVAAPSRVPPYEVSHPLLGLLQGWFGHRGLDLVHAAAVGNPDRGSCVLLAGKSGVGKSTTALAASRAGLALLADDYCLVAQGTPPRVASVYGSAKADAATIARLPFLATMVAANPGHPADDKAICFPGEDASARLMTEAELRAILVPRITPRQETSLHKASSAAALAALAPSTLLQLPAGDGDTLARLTEVVTSVPTHYLELGADPAGVGPAIAPLVA